MNYAKEVQKQLHERFCVLGFKKKKGILTKVLTKESSAFLGLGVTTHPDKINPLVSVFPVVGVQFDAIDRLGKSLDVLPPENNAIFSIALRYVVPDRKSAEYDFFPALDNGPTTERLAQDITDHGNPFFEAFSTLDRALDTIRLNLYPDLSGVREFLPLVQILRGNVADGARLAKETLSRMDERRGNGPRWAQFVANLEKLES